MSVDKSLQSPRPGKGCSLLEFPQNYTVIDIETTGLSPLWDEIIELSAIRYRYGVPVDTFTRLIRPSRPVDAFVSSLTGITNEMLADAPPVESVIRAYADFIGNDVVIGCNVAFDINFTYDALLRVCGAVLANDFVDVVRIARRALPELAHHRLCDLVEYFHVTVSGAHRGLHDCESCAAVYAALCDYILSLGYELETFGQDSRATHNHVHAKDIVASGADFDPAHPLYGKVCVFTGTLDRMLRQDAMQLVADVGGIPADGVTKKTNFLILGDNSYCSTIKDGKSNKQKKAEDLILKGADLQIIPEQVFYDMFDED